MSERGRKPGFTMSHEHRVKIQNSNILNALIEHVEGKREMSATQVSAGLGLLKKALPDLSSIEHAGDADNPIVHRIERLIVDPANPNR
jgi:hypothetical protein